MALITITGYPCSGKSTRAEQIRAYIQSKINDPTYNGPLEKVVVVSDDSLNIPRSVYDNSKTEKIARATLFTAVQRALGKSSVVIVDSGNYIKGYRYQMYCAARELSLRVATVFVLSSPEQALSNYTSLLSSSELSSSSESSSLDIKPYTRETFDNLIQRYEEPSSMARWDSPLFTILPTSSLPTPSSSSSSSSLETRMGIEELPLIWKAITEGDVKPPNPGTVGAPKPQTDALQILDSTTTQIVQSIISEQSSSGIPGGTIHIVLPASSQSSPSPSSSQKSSRAAETTKLQITLPPRTLTLPELQRHKRLFVNTHKKAVTLGSTEKGEVKFDVGSVGRRFGIYLEENVK